MASGVQPKISTFFAKGALKCVQSPEDSSTPPSKHRKVDRDPTSDDHELSLTPEQKERMDQKKTEARRLLMQRKVPQGVGQSWAKVLTVEFQKPYFIQVSVGDIMQ